MSDRELAARWDAALANAAELLQQTDVLLDDRARLQWRRKELLSAFVRQARRFVDAASEIEPQAHED